MLLLNYHVATPLKVGVFLMDIDHPVIDHGNNSIN